MQPAATYAAGKSYDWDDVVAVARKLDAGELKPADLDLRETRAATSSTESRARR